jgi:hypothetical protein
MLEDGWIDWQRSHGVDTRLEHPVVHNDGAKARIPTLWHAHTRSITAFPGAPVLEAQYAWEYTPEGVGHVAFFGTVRGFIRA